MRGESLCTVNLSCGSQAFPKTLHEEFLHKRLLSVLP